MKPLLRLRRVQIGVLITILILLISGTNSHADHVIHNCFVRHLDEAIQINRERRAKYSALSRRESEKISDMLLDFEGGIAHFAAKWYFDWFAEKYQKQGIPILCEDFVSMSRTPDFTERELLVAPKPVPAYPRELDIPKIRRTIKAEYKQRGFKGVSDYLSVLLPILKTEGEQYHCMTRHALESILRTALLAPRYMDRAIELNLSSPESLSWNFIQAQMHILPRNSEIDKAAFPVQSRWGIPIICDDVPQIIQM